MFSGRVLSSSENQLLQCHIRAGLLHSASSLTGAWLVQPGGTEGATWPDFDVYCETGLNLEKNKSPHFPKIDIICNQNKLLNLHSEGAYY